MNKLVFVTRKIPDVGIEMLRREGYEVDVHRGDGIPTRHELVRLLARKPYEALLSLLTDKIDASTFDSVPALKIVSNYAVGFDNIDIAEAKRRKIFVTNTPGDYVDIVAEHALALLFALSRRIVEGDRYVRNRSYHGWSPMLFMGSQIGGKTVGVVGAGRIGTRFAECLHRGFNAKIIYSDVSRNESIEARCSAEYVSDIDALFKRADIVSLHVPLLDSTRHLVDARRLALMNPDSYLINTSRGPVVDEHALVAALKNGIIRGAGLDVFEGEPNLAPGLSRLSNVVLTPHIASATDFSRDQMSTIAAQNIIDFFEGKELKNCVNA